MAGKGSGSAQPAPAHARSCRPRCRTSRRSRGPRADRAPERGTHDRRLSPAPWERRARDGTARARYRRTRPAGARGRRGACARARCAPGSGRYGRGASGEELGAGPVRQRPPRHAGVGPSLNWTGRAASSSRSERPLERLDALGQRGERGLGARRRGPRARRRARVRSRRHLAGIGHRRGFHRSNRAVLGHGRPPSETGVSVPLRLRAAAPVPSAKARGRRVESPMRHRHHRGNRGASMRVPHAFTRKSGIAQFPAHTTGV
jgi:hypothetical protein